ncbi:hypothetical protein BaRGS_00011233 [Batillaria attramentaria]|uniref:Uncharacterized protein n=1 Tax=Batillaria attramentaria TaxID=370345 RepID=A0ABD0LEF3_9CAEN
MALVELATHFIDFHFSSGKVYSCNENATVSMKIPVQHLAMNLKDSANMAREASQTFLQTRAKAKPAKSYAKGVCFAISDVRTFPSLPALENGTYCSSPLELSRLKGRECWKFVC